MKTIGSGLIMASFAALFAVNSAYAQPVTAGLRLHLDDAATNFTPAGGSPATWTDNSGNGNDMTGISVATSPTLSTGTYTGVAFNGTNQFMRNVTLNNTFATTEATLFVVRIAPNDTLVNNNLASYKATLSIAEDGTWNNEFLLITNAQAHHASSGNWTERRHQCYSSLPEDQPAIMTGVFEAAPANMDYQVNGISSTTPILTWGSPWNYPAVNRRFHLGGRIPSGTPAYLFEGVILEVLAYDRVLTPTEVADVTNYLKCKYSINYTTCNDPVDCPTTGNCSDSCYWRVTGNNIIGGNNKLGTLSDDDVRIVTSNAFRGIFTKKEGLLGWNTMQPTAYLHVYCDGHNKADGKISDVRFEKLEPGKGNILVINEEGYVLDSRVRLEDIAHMAGRYEEEKAKNEKLQSDIQELQAKVAMLIQQQEGTGVATLEGRSMLYQNTPNPFGKETSVDYYIDKMNKNAFIAIYDLNGKELRRYTIQHKGKGSVVINAEGLSQGMYLYSLIVDGAETDTKRMVLSNK